MIENDRHDVNATAPSRRRFIAHNCLAAGAVATTALLARMHSVHAAKGGNCAKEDQSPACRCFMKGTLIDIAGGVKKVEDLAAGDLIPTLFGGLQAIKWIGHYKHRRTDASRTWAKAAWPVRVARSAIAPNVPNADLFVTPAHALFLDGALVPVGNLVNRVTITLDPAVEYDELEFFHIKLERHDVISAQGALVETLRNVDESATNFADYYRKYGIPEADETPCAPIMSFNGGIGELKSRARSVISPLIDRRQQIDIIRDRLEARSLDVA